MMGNVNQNTPDGSLAYNQTGTYNWYDPYTGKTYNIPQFTATQTLSPEGQQIHDTNLGTQQNLSDIGNQQSGFLKDYLSNPVDLSSSNVDQYMNSHFMDQFNQNWDRQRNQMETKLANQGIGAGSDAYNQAMQQFSQQRQGATDQMQGDRYNSAVSQILQQRNQPINEITALLSGSQVQNPSFVNTNEPTIPTTDTAGIINQNYNQRLGAWQQQQAQTQGILGGLFGLGGGLLQGAGAAGGFSKLF